MGLLESLRNRGGLLGTVGQTLTDYQQLANAYPNASKFAEGLIKNLSAVAPPDPRNQQKSMQYAINRAFDVPGGFGGAIDVWHGSPHKFDAFDMSKIGTGEGAQAYGHGLYFAENPKVAKEYRDKLTIGEDYVNGELLNIDKPEHYLAWVLNQESGDISSAKEYLDLMTLRGGSPSIKATSKEAMNILEKGGLLPKLQYIKPEGNLYKTSLQWPDAAKETSDPLGPQHFLDWDKPLSEQPESVLSLMNTSALQNQIDDIYKKYPSNANPDDLFDAAWFSSNIPDHEQLKIDDLQNKINSIMKFEGVFKEAGGSLSGGNLIKRGEKNYSPELTSKTLSEIGIPGIRYLDGGSRGAGDGSYNYVVFDDQIPRILERNGIGLLNSLKR